MAFIILLFSPSSSSFSGESSAELFKTKCASCHAADGSGNTVIGKKMNLRDLRSDEVQKQSDEKLFDITAKGKGKMPGYEKKLSKEEVQGLVQYMRDLAKKK